VMKKHKVYALCRKKSTGLDALVGQGVTVIEGVDLSGDVSFLANAFKGVSIDVLVNNAAVFDKAGSILSTGFGAMTQATENVSMENLRYVFEVNTFGPVKMVQLLLPNIKSGGKVANISTTGGSLKRNSKSRAVPPPGGWLAYSGSKAALNMISRSMAIDLAPKGISVIAIHPGILSTNLFIGDQDVPDPAKGVTFTAEQGASGLYNSINWCSMDNSGSYVDALNYGTTKNTDPGSGSFVLPF